MRCFNFILVDYPHRALRAQSRLLGSLLFLKTIPEYVDLVVEICFHAVFEFDSLSLGVGWNREVEESLVDDLVIVHISHPLVEKVHLEGKERELQGIGDEGKGFGGILLLKARSLFPAALGQGLLDMFRLRSPG